MVLSVIDNLVKGASGQAIQNMNIMLGLDENAGLTTVAVMLSDGSESLNMSDPVGSKQYRSVVVQEHFGRHLAQRLLIVLLLMAVAVTAYWLGGRSMRADFQAVSKDYTELAGRLSIAEVAHKETSQQLVNLEVGGDIDRQAVNDVRLLVSEYKQTINQLNEEISFYKGLMAPTEKERGLGIRSWEI